VYDSSTKKILPRNVVKQLGVIDRAEAEYHKAKTLRESYVQQVIDLGSQAGKSSGFFSGRSAATQAYYDVFAGGEAEVKRSFQAH